jgi:DNA-binding transcriptional LysR family regulator
LHQEEFVAALPLDHALAGETTPLSLAALVQEPLVLYRRPDGVGIFDVLMDALRRAGFAPGVKEEVPRMITAINLVAAGQGVSLVPASMRVLHTESVAYRALAPGALPPMPLTLVYRQHDPSALVRNFIAVARKACGS